MQHAILTGRIYAPGITSEYLRQQSDINHQLDLNTLCTSVHMPKLDNCRRASNSYSQHNLVFLPSRTEFDPEMAFP